MTGRKHRLSEEVDNHYTKIMEDKAKTLSLVVAKVWSVYKGHICIHDLTDGGVFLLCDHNLIKRLLRSYMYDVIRHEEFHFEKNTLHSDKTKKGRGTEKKESIDPYKQVAYMVKWLVAYKPYTVHLDDEGEGKFSPKQIHFATNMNLLIAIHYAFTRLDIKRILPKEEYYHLVERLSYQLQHRPYNEGLFALMLEFMQKFYTSNSKEES